MPGGSTNGTFAEVTDLVRQNTRTADARRLDINNGLLQATFLVDCKDDQQLFAVIDKLKTKIPEASITFVDQRNSLAE